MRRVVFAAPGKLTTPTGGYAYDRRIIEELGSLGWRTEVVDLGDGFPFPSADARTTARRLLANLPEDSPIVIDGLAFGALPDAARELGASRALIALVHHPLALESGLSADDAAALRISERQALAHARRVIATSAFTARLLASEYGVPADRIRVVRPGNDRAARARPDPDGPPFLLAVGAIAHRKGYDVLLAALARLLDLPWRLTIVGARDRDPAAVARLDADLLRLDLAERVVTAGVVTAECLESLYARADLFVLASRFEGYGMAFSEAIAHGVPVVGAAAGAVAETVAADAGIFAAPNDVDSLSLALRRAIGNADERRGLAESAWRAAAELPTWEQAATLFSQAIETAA